MTKLKKIEQAFVACCPEVVELESLWNADTCATHHLDDLAYSLCVEPFDKTWIEVKKREAIKNSLVFYRKKGTDQAIREALNSMSLNCRLVYWHEDDSMDKGTFRIDVAHYQHVDRRFYKKLNHAINQVKRGSLHLESIHLKQGLGRNFYTAVAVHQTKTINV